MELLKTITVNNCKYNIEYFLGEAGSFWLVFAAWGLQTKTMLAYGVSAPGYRGGIQISNGL